MDDQEEKKLSAGESHRERVRKFGDAKTRTLQVAQYIYQTINQYHPKDQHKLAKAWEKIQKCGNWLEFHHYFTLDEYRLVGAVFCGNKWLDSLCGLRWAQKAVQSYYAKHALVMAENPSMKVCMLTLTVKNGKRLSDTYEKLEQALRKVSYGMRQAKKRGDKSEFGKIKGMVGAVEVKKTKAGKWHPHFHAVVLLEKYIDQERLSKEWYQKTGDSFITDIREMKNGIKGFCEVFSYTLKVSTMTCADQVEAFLKLNGKQMIRAYGLYQGVKVPDELTDEPLDDLPYTRILYRYAFKKGYSVEEMEVCRTSMAT
jgi:hypothetical protein